MHEHFQNLIHHTKMVVTLELLPDIDQIFVQRIEAPREKFGDVHGNDGMALQKLPPVFNDVKGRRLHSFYAGAMACPQQCGHLTKD